MCFPFQNPARLFDSKYSYWFPYESSLIFQYSSSFHCVFTDKYVVLPISLKISWLLLSLFLGLKFWLDMSFYNLLSPLLISILLWYSFILFISKLETTFSLDFFFLSLKSMLKMPLLLEFLNISSFLPLFLIYGFLWSFIFLFPSDYLHLYKD